MHALMPSWPRSAPRTYTPRARLAGPRLTPHDHRALLAEDAARRVRDREDAIHASAVNGSTWSEVIWSNAADFTAVSNTNTEASLFAGVNEQPYLPAQYFLGQYKRGRGVRLYLKGVLSTTGTPTLVFQVRMGTTSGSATLSGASVGVSAAITTASSVTNAKWELWLDLICNTPGIGTGNTTLSGAGLVLSPVGFASPFQYDLEPTLPPTATWTATIDNSLTQYVNASVTWGAASSSNTITCKFCQFFGWN